MSELRAIVDRLNDKPFEKDLTLVAFDEKSNFELLQVLNDVLAVMDARHDVDLRDEQDEQRGYRMTEFLRLLKYPIPGEVYVMIDKSAPIDSHSFLEILFETN